MVKCFVAIAAALVFLPVGFSHASLPPPPQKGSSFPALQIIDGPGIYCSAAIYVRLAQDEFVIERRQAPYGGDAQIELAEGRILLSSSISGEAAGKKVADVAEGALLLEKLEDATTYQFSGDAPGVDIFRSPGFSGYRQDKKLLDRIDFIAPTNGTVGDEKCLVATVIKTGVIR